MSVGAQVWLCALVLMFCVLGTWQRREIARLEEKLLLETVESAGILTRCIDTMRRHVECERRCAPKGI